MKKMSKHLEHAFIALILVTEIIAMPIIVALVITLDQIDGFIKIMAIFVLAAQVIVLYMIILSDILEMEDKK